MRQLDAYCDMKRPWDYQEAAAAALWNQIHAAPKENPLVVLPTGTGKSLTMAMFMWQVLAAYPTARILNLTHVKELIEGNYKELLALWPYAPAGIYSAGLRRRETAGQITFAGIGSFKGAIAGFKPFDIVIVDEAHRIGDNDKSTYQKVFKELRKKSPHLIVIGFTATDFRMGMGKLTDGHFFDKVCFDLSDGEAFVWMLEQRYLLRLIPRYPGFEVDAEDVKIRNGEYDEKSASQAFKDQDILERAVDEVIKQGQDRHAWLTFCQSIEDAELVADMFRYRGYPVEAVHSKRGDRDEILAAFSAGKLRGITNKDVLTTGYNNQRIDLIAMLRLCRSPGLWVQMLGRGTRPLWTPGHDLSTWDGRNASILASQKQNCLVLDFAGNTRRLGPINYPTLPKRKGSRPGDPPTRQCPQCDTHVHISLKCCPECGYEFPAASKLEHTASTAALILDANNLPPPVEKEYGVFRVTQMIAGVQPAKPGKWPTLRVDYFCGVRRFSTWVCPEHPGYASMRAKDWWKAHSRGSVPMPATASEMAQLFDTLTVPYFVKVWLNTKYPEIEAFDFMGAAFELPPELGGPPLAIDAILAEEAASRRPRQVWDDDDEIPF
jgi:DNA repair protein RadD